MLAMKAPVSARAAPSPRGLLAAAGAASLATPLSARCALGSEAEERYVDAIEHLKESITREQHSVRLLQVARATSYSRQSELEEFFLVCIDEARKDLARKRY